jgi:outer membrane protein assembly factor BamD
VFLSRFARLAVLVSSLSACAATTTAPLTPQRYEENARVAFQSAMAEYDDKNWETAITLFEQVKREYAYSHYARLAELRLGDIDFRQEKFPEAVTTYRAFIHDHPNDNGIVYARFQVCKALFEQVGDTIMLPPQEERELSSAADAYSAMKAFTTDFPRYERVPEVEYMLSVMTGLLVRHELYVARFYLSGDKFEAAANRCRYALEHFESSGLEPEALVLLGETYLKMKRKDDARTVFNTVIDRFPDSAFSIPAKNFLEHLEQKL